MVSVKLRNIRKTFGEVVALDNVSLDIKDGELFTLLGPSGCGKTTLLRIIAGLEFPDDGKVLFNDRDVTYVKASKRNTAMVFQNYALWPHMTVFENIAFGLQIRKYPKDEIKKKVYNILRLVRLEGLEKRFPGQLSGGQQQRVALARALVVEPDVLLLDEPLSNLDAKLRIEMREEIRRIQKEIGITTIYVTHDQEEALTISDRVAVMNRGRVLQVGTPIEIYRDPKNEFVASFIGKSTLLRGVLKKVLDGYGVVDLGGFEVKGKLEDRFREGERVTVIFRPEDCILGDTSGENRIEGVIESVMFIGSYFHIKLDVNGKSVLIKAEVDKDYSEGMPLAFSIPPDEVKIIRPGDGVEG